MYELARGIERFGSAVITIATPFVAGAAIAMLIDPVVRRVQSWHIRRTLSVFLVFGGFLVLTFGSAYITVPIMIAQASQLATTGPSNIKSLQVTVGDYLKNHRHKKVAGIRLPDTYGAALAKLSDTAGALLQKEAGNIVGMLVSLGAVVIQVVVTVIITFYLLIDYERLRARLLFLIPDQYRSHFQEVSADIGGVFAQYVRSMVLECLLYGITMIVLLACLSRVHPALRQSALLVGSLAGVLYAVPYLGPLTIGLLTFIVAFSAGGFKFALVAVAGALVVNQVYDNIVTPRMIGGGVGLNPVVALFALAMGGELFGLWGLILSVPVAASIQLIMFRVFPKLGRATPDEFLVREGVQRAEPVAAKLPAGRNG